MKATTLERLQVVLGADSNPIMQVMRKVKGEMEAVAKAVRQQTAGIRKQTEEITAPMQEAMEPTRQLNEELKKIVNIRGGRGLKDIQKDIERTEKKLRNLMNARDDLEFDGKHTEQTAAFKQLQKEIAQTEQSLKKMHSEMEELENSGKDTEYTKEYKEAIRLLEQEERKLRQLEERRAKAQALGGNAVRGASWNGLNYDLEEKRNSVNALKNDIANISGAEKFQNTGQWTALQAEIEKTEQKLAGLKSQMESMPDSEKYQNTGKWMNIQREIERTRVELAQLNAEQYEFNRTARVARIPRIFTDLVATLKDVIGGIRKASGAFASLIHKLKNGIPILSRFNKEAKNNGNIFGKGIFKVLKYTIGIRSLYALMGRMRSAIVSGFQNLAQYSDRTNESLSTLKSSMTTLKNALATAFSPILEVVTPYLNILITHLIEGANAISHFFAALTGSSTWTKAVKVQEDYAASLNGTASAAAAAKRELYGFDEITKQSDDSAGGAAGAGGVAIGDMFATEEVTNQFSDFAQKIKDAWKNADFTEIGNIVGEQLKKGLNKINWEGIKSQCNQIAKSIGTFINGFIQTEGLAESIGSTLGNAVNTGVSTAHTFFATTDFEGLGDFIAETANSFIDTTDFDLLGQTVAEGMKAGINTWYGFVTTFDFKDLGSKISSSITAWSKEMLRKDENGMSGWQKLGASLSKTLRGIVQTLTEILDTVPWEEVGQGIVDCLCEIDWENLIWDLGGFVVAFIKGIWKAIAGGISSLFKNKLKAAGIEDEESLTVYQDFAYKTLTGDYKEGIEDLQKYNSTRSKSEIIEDMDAFKATQPDGLMLLKPLEKKLVNRGSGRSFGEEKTDEIKWSKINSMGKTTATGKAAKNIVQGINTELGKTGLNIPVATETSAKDLLNPMQKAFAKNPLKSQVATTNSGSDVHKSIQKGFTNSGPFVTAAKTSNDGYFLFDLLQSDFSKDELHTGAKADTTGNSIFRGIQNVFGENSYHAKAKSDTSGGSIFSGVQGAFGQGVFHTGARSDTSGDSVRQGLQRTFGASALSTWSTVTNSGADLRKGLQNTFGNSPLKIGVSLIRDGWNTVTEWVNNFFGSGSSARGAGINKKANGGVFAGGSWHPVTAYASGGMPASGQFFMAREAGPELVGTIGGHTAVMNNNQIVASVSKGVYSATLAAMSQTMGGQRSSTPIEVHVHIGDKEVTDYVVKDINGRTLATGKCPIVT